MSTVLTHTIAIDVMGGDNAPKAALKGVELFLRKNKNFKFLLFGKQSEIEKYLDTNSIIYKYSKIINTPEVIGNDWKIVDALRRGKESSMWHAISAVANKKADAVVSAGNTGALMALSKLLLKTLPQIDRPAIINFLPAKKGSFVILDLGANAVCTPENLTQFAIMGEAFSKTVLDIESPRVALLNIGSEELKGNALIQETHKLFTKKQHKLNYIGFIEGDHIFNGEADVVVTDGFTGNVALKVLEGTVKFMVWGFKEVIKNSILSKIGLAFIIPALLKFRKIMDPRKYNGAMLIGLNGISVKSHGSSDEIAFSSAINATSKLINGRVNDKIEQELNS